MAPWDVVYPFDSLVRPKKHKMWVCVSKADLWFIRINTKKHDCCCVPLLCGTYTFLEHDSFARCGGDLITVPEIELEVLLGKQADPLKQGVVGSIHLSDRVAMCVAVQASPMLSPAQKRTISRELGCI